MRLRGAGRPQEKKIRRRVRYVKDFKSGGVRKIIQFKIKGEFEIRVAISITLPAIFNMPV
jgi:hypothetical protein